MVYSRPFASKAVFWAILKLEVWVRRWLFLLIEVESKAMRFWGKNRSGTGALSKHGFHPCPSIIRNSQRRTRECFLLLESTFLRVSRLATLFMHGLNTVFIFAALVMFCTFALPFWALFSQWPPPFLEGVSCALGVNDYVRFFTELGFFLYCYCCLSFSPSALSRFRFHFPRDNPFQLEFPLVDHLSMSSTELRVKR